MMGSRLRHEVLATQAKVQQVQEELLTLYTALTVRDPQFGDTLDAYNGLRQQVSYAATSRRTLLVVLAEMHKSLDHASSVDELRPKVDEWMRQAGVEAVRDPTREDLYEFVEDSGSEVVVDRSAYVVPMEGSKDVLIAMGVARRIAGTGGGGSPSEVREGAKPETGEGDLA